MGAVKTDHKRDAHLRTIAKVCRKWDREDQAKEAAEVRRHNRAVKAHKMKRMYPNSIAPERLRKEWLLRIKRIRAASLKHSLAMTKFGAVAGDAAKAFCKFSDMWAGVDLASGKDQTGYGGRIE